MPLNPTRIRLKFPSLDRPDIFFDNPGGTQIALPALEGMQTYLMECNANHGGAFTTSVESDARVDAARNAMADFFNASRPEEIIFGANMTTLTYTLSRALARTLNPGDGILTTHLDHDANISPWLQAAEDRGCTVRSVDFHPGDGTLDLDDFEKALELKPRLVAVGYASNALGTVNPLPRIIRLAHAAGAQVYVDAVHYAPHGPIDVQALDCDFLVCSAYKFFGPHLGILYGRYELLQSLPAYRVRPAPADTPGKFETGTGNFEAICGLAGALDYFEWLGSTFGAEMAELYAGAFNGRRLLYKQALASIRASEMELSRAFLEVLQAIPGLTLYGISDLRRLEQRVPTFSFRLAGKSPRQVAEALGKAGIHTWDGNFYALAVTTRLDVEKDGGLVRVGAAHYNTLEEVQRFGKVLQEIAMQD